MEGQEDQDFSKLSIDDRITHKNWKARVSAYEDLARLFPTFEDREFSKYNSAGVLKKIVLDTNAAAQEKGLAAVLAYIDYSPVAGKYVEPIIAGLATKCLNSTRAKTKELAGEIVLMCVEIERQDVVLEELIKGLEQKTPKNVAAVVRMITKALNLFGSKVIAIKPIVPVLAKLLEDRDPTVREDTKQLSIEIYRWVKDALLPQLSNLKPILLESLKEEFEKVKGTKATAERLLRSQQNRVQEEPNGAAAAEGPSDAVDGDVPEEEVDPFELMEPVDILGQLPGDFYTQLEATKWQDRKETLEKLYSLLEKNPKLVTTADYNDLVKYLKRIISKDTNIVVATLAIKCLTLLCTGLRKGFDKHANGCVTVVLEKFKEKKANVVQALREAIDAIFVSTNMEAIQEDLTGALGNKNPSIRSETALFMARAFAKSNPNLISKKLLTTYVTALIKTLGDSDPTVRESSAEALGTAAKAQGDRSMTQKVGPLLQALEPLKMAKIDEFKAKAEVKKFAAAPPPAPVAAPPSTVRAKPGLGPKKTTGARVVKPPVAAASSAASSMESLVDMPEPPPLKKPTASKFGAVKSRLDTGSARSTQSDSASGGPKYGTVKRPGTVGASRLAKPSTAGGSSKKSDDPTSSSPMMSPNAALKSQRVADERALKVLKWNFTTPREEFYAQLREQMETAGWNPSLVTNAFHSDFKFHIKAIDQMSTFFSKDPQAYECVVANLDLVLKWFALRFYDTNPSVIMKALELLLLMFRLLERNGYSMTDNEANAFVPYLVNKSGDAKDVVRNRVREILVILRGVHPAAKIFSHLYDGLQSKNSRQRATCLEEIASLIEHEGMAIFGRPNSVELKDIAKFVSERDNGVRNGALSCIVKVYQHEGENVYKLVGNLNDKDLSLIEERIKRAPKTQRIPVPAQHLGTALHHADTNGSSGGLPARGSGLPGAARFGGTMTRPAPSHQQQQHHTPDSHMELPRPGTMTKIGSLSNMMSKMSLEANGTPGGGGGSPYDTYAKPKGGTGTIGKVRSLSGLGFGIGKTAPSPMAAFNRPSPMHSSSKMQFDSGSDADSVNGGYLDSSSQQSPAQSTSGAAPVEPMDTEVESISVVTTSTDESDDLYRRIREALANNEDDLDPEHISRLRSKYEGTSLGGGSPSTASLGASPRSANGTSPGSSPASRYSTGTAAAPALSSPPNAELAAKFNRLFTDLSSADSRTLTTALEHLNNVTKKYDSTTYSQYLDPKVEQLIVLCNKQFRLFLTRHYPNTAEDPAGRESAVAIFRLVSLLVVRVFNCTLGRLVSRDTLRELITHLLPYFLEEMKKTENKAIFDSVNYVIQELLKGADTTNLVSALIRMLHDYVGSGAAGGGGGGGGNAGNLDTFKQLTMKFMWRIEKFFDNHYQSMNVEVILKECHLFFKSYPRSWWRNNSPDDDMPLRTIKTLIYLIVCKKGDAILGCFTLIENKDESELSYYVQKSLRQAESAGKDTASESGGGSGGKLNGSTASSVMETPSRVDANGHNGTSGSDENEVPGGGVNGLPKITGLPTATPGSGYIPRVHRPDFPLPTRQLNNLTNQIAAGSPPTTTTTTTIPIIRTSEDLRTLCNYTARTHNIPLDYDAIHEAARAKPLLTMAEAEEAVALARERLNNMKAMVAQQRLEQQQPRASRPL